MHLSCERRTTLKSLDYLLEVSLLLGIKRKGKEKKEKRLVRKYTSWELREVICLEKIPKNSTQLFEICHLDMSSPSLLILWPHKIALGDITKKNHSDNRKLPIQVLSGALKLN